MSDQQTPEEIAAELLPCEERRSSGSSCRYQHRPPCMPCHRRPAVAAAIQHERDAGRSLALDQIARLLVRAEKAEQRSEDHAQCWQDIIGIIAPDQNGSDPRDIARKIRHRLDVAERASELWPPRDRPDNSGYASCGYIDAAGVRCARLPCWFDSRARLGYWCTDHPPDGRRARATQVDVDELRTRAQNARVLLGKRNEELVRQLAETQAKVTAMEAALYSINSIENSARDCQDRAQLALSLPPTSALAAVRQAQTALASARCTCVDPLESGGCVAGCWKPAATNALAALSAVFGDPR